MIVAQDGQCLGSHRCCPGNLGYAGGDLTSHQVTISGSQMSTTHWPT
jgi:hypothetical protein